MNTGDVITYLEMCSFEHSSLQRGMNFHLDGDVSVLLMSTRDGAPYDDQVQDGGSVLIYEGHDAPRSRGGPDPKAIDQPMHSDSGSLTQNGQFHHAAHRRKAQATGLELVRVYEKVRRGIWVFNGTFDLVDAWQAESGGRMVFKFRLELLDAVSDSAITKSVPDHSRIIPSHVKQQVWKRDKGQCVQCGSTDHLHFDHIIPYSKGGTSLVADNIQLLCARHNLDKRDRIV